MESLTEPQHFFEDERVAERFVEHYADIRGAIRLNIIKNHLGAVVPVEDGLPRFGHWMWRRTRGCLASGTRKSCDRL